MHNCTKKHQNRKAKKGEQSYSEKCTHTDCQMRVGRVLSL